MSKKDFLVEVMAMSELLEDAGLEALDAAESVLANKYVKAERRKQGEQIIAAFQSAVDQFKNDFAILFDDEIEEAEDAE